ncbi:hypothetical protein Scep_000727 [Stephania cephalantha]|uniref:Uncharacterized protein n=1 Tax=Stephania cephalantha TaxID=152367 RepID=A0AAP0Q703_9MAGN
MALRRIPRVSENMPLYDILNEFQKGHSHIAVVVKDLSETKVLSNSKDAHQIETKVKPNEQKVPDSTPSKEGGKPEVQNSQTAVTTKDGNQLSSARPLAAPGSKRRHRGCSHCILDIENSPIPEFPPNEIVVGVITMEDVIEELLQEEIYDETDGYINVHNRIKVNMQASQEKIDSFSNSPKPSPTATMLASVAKQTQPSALSQHSNLSVPDDVSSSAKDTH